MNTEPTNEVADADVWLDVVAAVDYLTETHRLGLTVWDAVEEAVRWWTTDALTPPDDLADVPIVELPWDDPDPLRSTLERLLTAAAPIGTIDGHDLPAMLTSALAVWVNRMSALYNDHHRFAHPQSRSGWPSPAVPR